MSSGKTSSVSAGIVSRPILLALDVETSERITPVSAGIVSRPILLAVELIPVPPFARQLVETSPEPVEIDDLRLTMSSLISVPPFARQFVEISQESVEVIPVPPFLR